MNAKQEAKVVWFIHRTGATAEEAEKFLKEAKFKIEVAIRLQNAHYENLYRTRLAVGDIVTPDDSKL